MYATLKAHKRVLTVLAFIVALMTVSTTGAKAQLLQYTPAECNAGLCSLSPEVAEALHGCRTATDYGNQNSIIRFWLQSLGGATYTQRNCFMQDLAAGTVTEEDVGEYLERTNNSVVAIMNRVNYQILDQRPASGIVFAIDHTNRLVTPDTAFAQSEESSGDPAAYFPGQGFDLLRPIQQFWGWSVTVSYSFLILVIVAVAFAMMFRSRLGGKEIVQIQNAIPGIVMAMILIPLSYPLSGLFIDAITLGTNVVHGMFFAETGVARAVYENGRDGQDDDAQAFNDPDTRGLYADDPRLGLFDVFNLISVRSLADVDLSGANCDNAEGVAGTACDVLSTGLDIFSVITDVLIGIVPGDTDSEDVGNKAVGIIGDILQLLFTVIGLVTGVRILKRLLLKLVVLMILPIISPFIFATMAVPGRGTETIMWFLRRMGAAAAFYIVTYALFLLAIVLTNESFVSSIPGMENYSYTPPFISPFFSEFVSGNLANGANLLFVLLAIGIYIMIPSTLDNLNKSFGVDDGLPPILKTVGNELKYTADMGFRQAPAAALYAGSRVGTAFTAGTARTMSGRSTPFDKTYGEKRLEDVKKRVGSATAWASSFPLVGKPLGKAVGAAAGAAGNVAGRLLTGEGGKVTGAGDKLNVTVEVTINNASDVAGFGANTYDPRTSSLGLTGEIKVKIADDSKPITGKLLFRKYGPAIGTMKGPDKLELIPTTGVIDKGTYFESDKFLQGEKDFKVGFRLTPTSKPGDFTTDDKVQVALDNKKIGEGTLTFYVRKP